AHALAVCCRCCRRPRPEEPVMSDPSPGANPPEPSIPPPTVFGPGSSPAVEPRLSTKRVLIAALPMVAIVAFVAGMVYHRATQVKGTTLSPALIATAQMRLTKGLDPRFSDADKDLVADCPKADSDLVDPETLVFSYIATDDPKNAVETWKPLMDHLASA